MGTTAVPLLLEGLLSMQFLAEDKKKNGKNHNPNSSVGSMMEHHSHAEHFHSRVWSLVLVLEPSCDENN